MATPKQTDPQFKLRMTPKLKEQIEEAASENNRSMNAEIIARLEKSFDSSLHELVELQREKLKEERKYNDLLLENLRECIKFYKAFIKNSERSASDARKIMAAIDADENISTNEIILMLFRALSQSDLSDYFSSKDEEIKNSSEDKPHD